ncbi:pyridoxal phosphate-dependent aminotransferase [Nesterenkonia sp. LB17]|uniref:pyridoxal phosphate-dependent aminotransferase n=1 Tax=unclassified Nesterenkonia TaxID=2629769 RepID=UPI001F4D14FF|nr:MULTISPECIES: pyridoxal phosphate-dependent aminotransferase [unclassified Nesterenkonia]MCH8561411.1 pyridoxal phosphate-dependent aminotransferase [Nesterenkonia sp. DZ6]MCH8563856.1 pyridoxal phosphate-dependent aminotransferase [Nesterenkonia sp. YGD6]MCH8566450.1 pyridoxal phosphate-dependent aminotransferase [Nesterenkonia sp. LB17]MCH8571983.1 pyridoxal phosphate-dependent aminotransferase [Nesterenkonia sp. AY15]
MEEFEDFTQAQKLRNVRYDVRGPIAVEAARLERAGHRITKLNIGNMAPFGFDAPDSILVDMIKNLPSSQGYSESQGIYSARTAVAQYYQSRGMRDAEVSDVILGNGVSELITMVLQALLNPGDEVLIPAPDYPLWTAITTLCSGRAVHYVCDEENHWWPDPEEVESKVTDRTKALVLINPNNPTGAVYPREILEAMVDIARRHNLLLLSDEIYEKITFDDAEMINACTLADDVFTITFSGLSKTWRVAGFRSGWLYMSGPKHRAKNYIEGLNLMSNLRMCPNVPAQHAIQTALGGYQSVEEFIRPGGRLYEQRNVAHKLLAEIEGVDVHQADGALYLFPRLDPEIYPIQNDETFVMELLRQQKILVSHGRAFNWIDDNHFRLVSLPPVEELEEAIAGIADFLASYRDAFART